MFADFEVARRSAKPSPHSERAARSEFAAIDSRLQESTGNEQVTLGDLTPKLLRLAFAPEVLLQTVAAGGRPARWPWPERDLAFLATTRRQRFPGVKLGPKAPLFVDRRGDRLKRGGAHYLVERSYQAAGLTNRVPNGAMVHALRHTFATRLAEDGASATEIQALLGHESLNTSQGYIDAAANQTRQAARANRTSRVLEEVSAAKKPPNRPC